MGWRDRVLDNARVAEGETLLDVGCGEGLIGPGALERGAGTVIFSEISQDLLISAVTRRPISKPSIVVGSSRHRQTISHPSRAARLTW